jgi:hypothetical protein
MSPAEISNLADRLQARADQIENLALSPHLPLNAELQRSSEIAWNAADERHG